MSCGKAILASDIPTIREVLKHQHSCIFCKSDDINDWVNSLLLLYKDETKRKMLGANARKVFMKKYTWNARAKNILKSLAI